MKTIWFPIVGGLGNQMFEVAHATDFTRKAGAQPRFFSISKYDRYAREWELGCFGIAAKPLNRFQNKILRRWMRWARRLHRLHTLEPEHPHSSIKSKSHKKMLKYILHELHRIKPDLLNLRVLSEGRYYAGYVHPKICFGHWQGECFFADSADQVKKMFTFPEIAETPFGFILDGSKPNVAMHIRRGDYVSNRRVRHHILTCNTSWYRKALQKMRDSVPGAVFHIFSDDQSWVEKQFGHEPDVSLVKTDPNAPAWIDMALMTKCQHFIMSNSTYSWWAVYLGRNTDSVIIAPRIWLRDPLTPTCDHTVYCKEWQLV